VKAVAGSRDLAPGGGEIEELVQVLPRIHLEEQGVATARRQAAPQDRGEDALPHPAFAQHHHQLPPRQQLAEGTFHLELLGSHRVDRPVFCRTAATTRW
jgi:hypothetical protein